MSSKFRLLITTDTSNEIWNYVTKLCESIKISTGADILIIIFGGKPNNSQEEEIKSLNVETINLDYTPEKNAYLDKKDSENLLIKHINEFQPDIVHLNHYFSISDKVKCPVVITGHGDLINMSKWTGTNIKQNFKDYRQTVNDAVNKANFVILTSRFTTECLIREYDLKNRFRVIYNGINIKPSEDFPDIPCILAEGNSNDRSKNLEFLNKIAHKIPNNIKIRVIGKNFCYKNSRRIEWLSNLSSKDTLELYRNSSVFLALSSYDLFGYSSITSAYSNCAILANNTPVNMELWGDCACIYEKNNLNSFIRNLNNLLENKRMLKNIAKNCQSKALSSFNIKRMGMEYINIYKDLIQSKLLSQRSINELNKDIQIP
jgi:glycosyltransferase involved in cell wall biosynthesis